MRVTFDTTNPTEMAMARKILAEYPETTNTVKPKPRAGHLYVDWVNGQCRRHVNRRYFVNSFIRQALKSFRAGWEANDQYLSLYPVDSNRMGALVRPAGVVQIRDLPAGFPEGYLVGTERITAPSEIANGWAYRVTLDSRAAVNTALELLNTADAFTRK